MNDTLYSVFFFYLYVRNTVRLTLQIYRWEDKRRLEESTYKSNFLFDEIWCRLMATAAAVVVMTVMVL